MFGTPAGRHLFVPPGVPLTPRRCPRGFFLILCAFCFPEHFQRLLALFQPLSTPEPRGLTIRGLRHFEEHLGFNFDSTDASRLFFCIDLTHLFFARQEKKDFPVFLWGDPVQNRPQNQPLQVAFSLLERLEVPERGDFGEENCLGRGGVGRAKKGKKG